MRDEYELESDNESVRAKYFEIMDKYVDIDEDLIIAGVEVIESVPLVDDVDCWTDDYILVLDENVYKIYAIRLTRSNVLNYLLFQLFAPDVSPGFGIYRVVIKHDKSLDKLPELFKVLYDNVSVNPYKITSGYGFLVTYSIDNRKEYTLIFKPNYLDSVIIYTDNDFANVIYAIYSAYRGSKSDDEFVDNLESVGLNFDEELLEVVKVIGMNFIELR